MKLIHLLQIMLALLAFFTLAASASVGDENKTQKDITEYGPLIPTNKMNKKTDPKLYTRIAAYVFVTSILLIILPWVLWRIISNWGSWKIHTPSPRPQYIRTPLGWVDRDAWQLKQAKKAKRKAAKRYKHKVYRSTRANYKWIFHDPTGELQQRFNDQREQSYLRFVPSWMRSYPHGTLQSGTVPQQSTVPKDAYELPNLHFSGNSCRSRLEALGNAQLDGVSTSGAFSDPYQLPGIWDMDYRSAIMPSTAGKSRLPPRLPMVDGLGVIQVWHVRANPLPERTGRPRLESEAELRGEVESPEEIIRRDTEHRLAIGRAQQERTQLERRRTDERDANDQLIPRQISQHETQIEGLGRRIFDLAGRIQDIRTERTLLLIRGTLDNLVRELRGTSRDRRLRRPIPQNAREANILQQYFAHIATLERQVHGLYFVYTEPPVRDTLEAEPDSGVLVRVGPTVRRPDTRAILDPVQIIDRLTSDDLRTHLPNVWNPSDTLSVHASPTTTDAFNQLYQRLIATRVNASTPTTVASQTDGAADRGAIEDPATDDNIGPNPVSEEISEGPGSVVTEGPTIDDTSDANPASEEDLQPDTRNPIAAALLRSVPDHDTDLEQADPAAQRHLESEEGVNAEAVRLTADFYTEMGNSDPAPDVHVQEAQAGDDAAPVNVGGQSPSTASVPNPSAGAPQEIAAAALLVLDGDDGLHGELESDAH